MIKITLIEDHNDFREIVSDLINQTDDMQVINEFSSVETAIQNYSHSDLILLDIGLPGKSGIDGLKYFKKNYPKTLIIMLTNMIDDDKIYEAITEGADGYLLKKTTPQLLLESIRDALIGGATITPFIAKRMIETFNLRKKQSETEYQLSARELEVLQFLVQGMNYKMIAAKIFLSPETIRNHIKNIYEKLHVHSRSEAVAKAMKERII